MNEMLLECWSLMDQLLCCSNVAAVAKEICVMIMLMDLKRGDDFVTYRYAFFNCLYCRKNARRCSHIFIAFIASWLLTAIDNVLVLITA